jgi:hypothetical protein
MQWGKRDFKESWPDRHNAGLMIMENLSQPQLLILRETRHPICEDATQLKVVHSPLDSQFDSCFWIRDFVGDYADLHHGII